jgi:hypothetical protein
MRVVKKGSVRSFSFRNKLKGYNSQPYDIMYKNLINDDIKIRLILF